MCDRSNTHSNIHAYINERSEAECEEARGDRKTFTFCNNNDIDDMGDHYTAHELLLHNWFCAHKRNPSLTSCVRWLRCDMQWRNDSRWRQQRQTPNQRKKFHQHILTLSSIAAAVTAASHSPVSLHSINWIWSLSTRTAHIFRHSPMCASTGRQERNHWLIGFVQQTFYSPSLVLISRLRQPPPEQSSDFFFLFCIFLSIFEWKQQAHEILPSFKIVMCMRAWSWRHIITLCHTTI